MKKLARLLLACAASAALPQTLSAADPAPKAAAAAPAAAPAVTVTVGGPAPAIANGDYAQGEAVKKFDSDKVYLMEFWATWCGPCIASIPHVNDLQKKYADKGFVVIGQNVWEKETDKVKPFLEKMGDKMTYRVAFDDTTDGGKGKMAETWMAAAGRNGIPCAFLVGKDQKIAWIGHPMQLEDKIIEGVLAGTYDVAGAAKKYEEENAQQMKLTGLMRSVRKNLGAKDWDAAAKDIDELTPLFADKQPYMTDLLRLELNVSRRDLPAAVALTKKIAADNPKNTALVANACTLLSEASGGDKAASETADSILTEVAARDGKNVQVLIARAKVKKALGQDAEATELAKAAVAAVPEKSQSAVKQILKGLLPAEGE